jgi:hypothetical protein
VAAQKGRRRRSADSRGAAGAENAEQDVAEDAAGAGQAAEGRARAKGREDAGSWLRARVRRNPGVPGQSMQVSSHEKVLLIPK